MGSGRRCRRVRATDPTIPCDAYGKFVRAIVSQNISSFASRSIFQRLTDVPPVRCRCPRRSFEDDPDELRRAAGLSAAKTTSLRSLASQIVSGDLDLARLPGTCPVRT
jgi:3-methyladenine DNA glycosylase/8-oxoguanine DNA glycosylase